MVVDADLMQRMTEIDIRYNLAYPLINDVWWREDQVWSGGQPKIGVRSSTRADEWVRISRIWRTWLYLSVVMSVLSFGLRDSHICLCAPNLDINDKHKDRLYSLANARLISDERTTLRLALH
jgi:hypothetical protein